MSPCGTLCTAGAAERLRDFMSLVMQRHDGRKMNIIGPIQTQLHVSLPTALFYAKTARVPAASSQHAGSSSPYSWCNLSSSDVGK